MFEPFNSDSNDPTASNNAIDEWTLCEQLGSNLTAAMTEHYDTFIVSLQTPLLSSSETETDQKNERGLD